MLSEEKGHVHRGSITSSGGSENAPAVNSRVDFDLGTKLARSRFLFLSCFEFARREVSFEKVKARLESE